MSAAKKISSNPISNVDAIEPLEVVSLVLDSGVAHVLQNQHPFGKKDGESARGIVLDKRLFFDHPIAAIFAPKSPDDASQYILFNEKFCEAVHKKNMLDAISKILEQQIKSVSLHADILTIADEMFTNAVYNAPFVDMENTQSGISRETVDVRMDGDKKAQMWIACDEERILIMCEDDYGTLNPLKMLERVRKVYATSVGESMNMTGRGGAGIGSFMMFNASVSFFVGVEKNKKTLIGCILPRKGSNKTRMQMVKNLHFIFSN